MNSKQNLVGKRLIAQLADMAIYGLLSLIPVFFFSILIGILVITLKPSEDSVLMAIVMFATFLSIPTTYGILTYIHLKNKSATLGYRMMGIKLVLDNGEKISNRKIMFRTIIKVILIPIYLIFIVGLIHLLALVITYGRQDLLDKLFGTKAIIIN